MENKNSDLEYKKSVNSDSKWTEIQADRKSYRKDTWKTRLKKQTGYMLRPPIIKIHPDKAKKRVMIKSMYNAGWGSKMLSLWFKTSQNTVNRIAKTPTPEHLLEFEQSFKMAMHDYDNQAVYRIKERLLALVPTEENMEKLVKAGEFFKGPAPAKQTNIQNNLYGDLIKRFTPQTIEPEK